MVRQPKSKRGGRPDRKNPRQAAARDDAQDQTGTVVPERERLAPGLWIVATPIGNARDITLRALDVLRSAEVLACEDTRRTRSLLSLHGIPVAGRTMISYNDTNGAQRRPAILEALARGQSVALASDAGTPLIADPGYKLVRMARAEGAAVHTVPGPSSLTAALTVAGQPTDRIHFAGFLPAKATARRTALTELARIDATLVLFETARRLPETIAAVAETFDPAREAAICRELTKLYEEAIIAPIGDLADGRLAGLRGEVVMVIAPPDAGAGGAIDEAELDADLKALVQAHGVSEAARQLAARTGLNRRDLYARALTLGGGAED